MLKITAKGGPIDGKSFTVPEGMKTFTHHAAPGGHYKVNTKTATWQQDDDLLAKNVKSIQEELDKEPPGGPINTEAFAAEEPDA